jgi:hypothetical protein
MWLSETIREQLQEERLQQYEAAQAARAANAEQESADSLNQGAGSIA